MIFYILIIYLIKYQCKKINNLNIRNDKMSFKSKNDHINQKLSSLRKNIIERNKSLECNLNNHRIYFYEIERF